MPAEPSDGYLWVAVADVDRQPLQPAAEHRPAGVRRRRARRGRGRRSAASAWPTASPRRRPTRAKPAFTVDENFGKSLLIVIRTDRPLFDTLRPTTETIASFSEDLGRVLQAGQVRILSIATQVIDSRG